MRSERSPSRTGCGKRQAGVFRGCRTNRGFRRGRCRRIKRRMLRCRQIDINRHSLSRAGGQRVTVHRVVGTPRTVQSANILSKFSAVTLMVDRLDLGFETRYSLVRFSP